MSNYSGINTQSFIDDGLMQEATKNMSIDGHLERNQLRESHNDDGVSFWRSWFGFGGSSSYDTDSDSDADQKRKKIYKKTNEMIDFDHRPHGPKLLYTTRKSSAELRPNFNRPELDKAVKASKSELHTTIR